MPYIDITGKRFGRYTVLRYVGNDKHGCALWECQCDCGKIKTVVGSSLRQGTVVSCGCYHKDALVKRLTTHDLTHTRLHLIWHDMKQRCLNPNSKAFPYYGKRGITICDEWKNDFIAFYQWATANGYADDLTIDRIDTDKGYDPTNCRWVSRKVQQNNRRANIRFEINGEQHTIPEWCEIYNMPPKLIRSRVCEKGWDIVKALTTPLITKYSHPFPSSPE